MAPIHLSHRAVYRKRGDLRWVSCSCGWLRWARDEVDARGLHRDHKHRVIRLSKRKAS